MERVSWASIVLIPKVNSPDVPGDFRLISLINSTLKITSKMLVSCLGNVLHSLVDEDQSAFLKGRCILNNIATAEELIFSMHRHSFEGHILKMDFAKAFDFVEWEFLLDLLKVSGFGNRFTLLGKVIYSYQRVSLRLCLLSKRLATG